MTEWTPKAGEDAVVRVVGPSPNLEGFWIITMPHAPSGVFTVHESALRPLPSALTAEDAAVLRAADAWFDDGLDVNGSCDRLSQAVRSRRHPTPPAGEPAQDSAAPKIAALERAVVEAVSALIAKARRSWPGDRANALGWGTEGRALSAAHDALLAALAPPDPVVELREAAAAYVASHDTGESNGDEFARLRAALSALPGAR